MESNVNNAYSPFEVSSGPPSAPPGDSYYPSLPNEKIPYQQEPPPPYTTSVSAQDTSAPRVTQVTPQMPSQGLQQASRVVNHQNPSPSIVATTNHPQPVQVVLQGDLGSPIPPGVCHICRKGKIKDAATCCSWVACIFLLPFGIIPGLIAFCYACRKPKCTRCGFVHGKRK